MKKTLLVSMAFGLALAVGNAYAGTTPASGILGSAHDLGDDNLDGKGDQRVCVYCHTPHYSQAPTVGGNLDYSPLWNKDLSTIVSWQLYDNGQDPTGGRHALNANLQIPTSVSLLCLSCHDGSVALNAYGNDQSNPLNNYQYAGGGPNSNITDYAPSKVIGLGGDLSVHHPVEFDYEEVALADPEIAPSSATMIADLQIKDLLAGNTMTCASCHDVHNTQSVEDMFVWQTNVRSEFCFVCHLK